MKNVNKAREIEKEIEQCDECTIIDKPYVKYGPYMKYLPATTTILVVSESPPPGKKQDFIYNIDSRDRLREVLSHIFHVNEKEIPQYLRSKMIFWSTAVKCRPISKAYIEEMRKKCVKILRKEIEILSPKIIIALGKVAWKSIDEIRPRELTILKHYHPLYIWRFQRHRINELRNLLLNSHISENVDRIDST